MVNWEDIKNDWETSKITLKALAEKYDVKLGTLKSRKSREGWSRDPAKKDATIQKDATTETKKDATQENSDKKQRYKEGSRKGAGNPNPENQFTERNSAALKHGLFSRYIPKETLELMGSLNKDEPADIVWDQIMLQYAAIIRAQQIMFVEDKNDTVKELKKLKIENGYDNEGNSIQIPIEKEYELQFAWDRHATFMNAQSRAMSEFRSLIKQFNDMAYDDDERLLKLEQMQLGIDKTKAETEKLTTGKNDGPIEIMIKRKGDG